MYEGVIAKGIERLTERFGWEWVEWVDWEILRMDCYTKCVAGQIGTRLDADSYYYSTLRSLDVEFAEEFGFDVPTADLIPLPDQSDDERYEEVFGALTEEWKNAVTALRAEWESSPVLAVSGK